MDPWSFLVLSPVLNILIALTQLSGGQLGISIVLITIIVRGATYPLTVRQLRSTKSLQVLQPKLQELQKKYGRNKQKLQQETMKMYKESGISPVGCLWPMLVQMPVWIALYQSIVRALASTPGDLLDLARHLYHWKIVYEAIPIDGRFLWLDLAKPDQYMILAVLVGGTMWLQQKMVTPPATSPQQQSMNQMSLMMMPFMFAIFTVSFPSGLALYWAVSNIIGIVVQYFIGGGWGYLHAPPMPPTQISPKQRGKGR